MYQKKPDTAKIRRIGIGTCVVVILLCVGYLASFMISSRKNAKTQQENVQKYVVATEATVAEDSTEETQEATEPKYHLSKIDFESLQKESQNVIGWIQIPDLETVDYPLCWNGDNMYFLNHSWNDESTIYGAIFLEESNSPGFYEPYQIIYGHAMNDGSMFAGLGKFTKEEFFRKHENLVFVYLPKETRVYQVFSVEYIDSLDETVYKPDYSRNEFYGKALEVMQKRSVISTDIKVDQNSSVITLSTCAGGDRRLVVHAVLIDTVPVEKK